MSAGFIALAIVALNADDTPSQSIEALPNQQAQDSVSSGEALQALARNLHDQGRHADEEAAIQQWIELANRHDSLGRNAADALWRMVRLLEEHQRAEDAAPYFQTLLLIARDGTDPELAHSLDSIASTLRREGRNEDALTLSNASLRLRETNHDPYLLAQSLADVAAAFEAQRHYSEAEVPRRRAIAVLEAAMRYGLASAQYQALATNLELQGRSDEAAETLRSAFNLALQDNFLADGEGFALRLERHGLYDQAVAIMERARAGSTAPSREYARLLYRQRQYASAEREARRAYTADANDPLFAGESANTLAVSLHALDRDTEAMRVLRTHLTTEFGPSAFIAVDNLAWLLLQAGERNEAKQLVDRHMIGRHGEADEHDYLRISATMAANPAASLAMRIQWEYARAHNNELQAIHRAFEQAQLAFASETSESFQAAVLERDATEYGLQPSVSSWRAERARLADVDTARSIARSMSAHQFYSLSREREEIQRRIRELESEFRCIPNYFYGAQNRSSSAIDAQHLMHDDDVLLLMTPGDPGLPEGRQRGLVFAVTRDGIATAEITMPPSQLREEIEALRGMLSGGFTGDRVANTGLPAAISSGARGFDRARAHRLYVALFDPGGPVGSVLSTRQRWILAPQGLLLDVPFAALVTQPPEGNDSDPAQLRRTPWLGFERALQIAPSIPALRMLRYPSAAQSSAIEGCALAHTPRTYAGRTQFFGVGDPVFGRGNETAAAEGGDPETPLSPLPQTRVEITALAREFRAEAGATLLGADATESAIKALNASGALRRTNLIVFATHGLRAGERRNLVEPALALTVPLTPTSLDDGYLTTSEVARLRFDADWVILSACNTAAASRSNGEALSGLSRAFLAAGARALLVSQWPVNDVAAARLTVSAIEYRLSHSVSEAEALRHAMIELANGPDASFAHPRLWAPFVVVGGE